MFVRFDKDASIEEAENAADRTVLCVRRGRVALRPAPRAMASMDVKEAILFFARQQLEVMTPANQERFRKCIELVEMDEMQPQALAQVVGHGAKEEAECKRSECEPRTEDGAIRQSHRQLYRRLCQSHAVHGGAWNCPEDSGKDSDQLAGECSNCFVRVATSACYGHVMHTSDSVPLRD
eukprot:symbB.v1.2.012927.t1/scaffold904.1/size155000/1